MAKSHKRELLVKKGMAGAKQKYIEAAYELLERDGLKGVSIRKVAEQVGCSSTALYRHFPDIDKLVAVASIRFLRDYIEDARVLSQVDLNPLELNLQLWECLAFYSFRNADLFENLFYGDPTGRLYSEAVTEYFTNYPDDLMGLKDFMFDLFMTASIADRDLILLERAEEMGMLTADSAAYLCKIDGYLYRGMLASLRGGEFDEEEYRKKTREFIQLMITAYTNELEKGYSILVVSPDFVPPDARYDAAARSSFRVKVIPGALSKSKKKSAKKSAKETA